jgi:fumarate hydratase subunit alpha
MRIIQADEITKAIREMCIQSNLYMSEDMKDAIISARKDEEGSSLASQILGQLEENLKVADELQIPICQDTGMTVVFAEIGQEAAVEGGLLRDAINEGIRQGYTEGYLRKSVVGDPVERRNTGDNTPGIIHFDIVSGDRITLTVAPKGAGSENMSRLYMLKPSDGLDKVKHVVLSTVEEAGPNACPPLVVGVGIGGNFEECALLSKKALTRDINVRSSLPWAADLEKELLDSINATGIGPAGLGGKTTALAVNIEAYATHIACLPVAVNLCCHVNRHVRRVL